jgi:hypothetical protein
MIVFHGIYTYIGTQEIMEIILFLFVTPAISIFYLINMHIENYELGSQYLINLWAIKLYVHLFFVLIKCLINFLQEVIFLCRNSD